MFREIEPGRDLFVIADVHGDFDALAAALEQAPEGAFIVQLGDLVDRGPFSPLCAELMLDLVEAGRAVFIAGNHDAALADVAAGGRAPTPGRAETLEQFAAHSDDLLERFVAAVRNAPLCLRVGDIAMAHAAWSPAMESDRAWSEDLRRMALQGERRPVEGRRRQATSYAWIDRVPEGRLVVVGHEIRGDGEPMICEGARGGRAMFLDLGCGSGGALGCAVLAGGDMSFLAIPSHAGAASDGRGED